MPSSTAAAAPPGEPSSIWSAEGRVGRAHYFWVSVLTSLAAALLTAVLPDESSGGAVLALLLLLPLAWLAWVASIKRCHDIGHSGWMSLLFLVPFVNVVLGLYLLFKRGTSQDNEYGPPLSLSNAPSAAASKPAAAQQLPPDPKLPTIADPEQAAEGLDGDAEEELWARALAECEDGSRRAGLWAREFSKAGGVESAAKAGYVAARVEELRREVVSQKLQRLASEAAAERDRLAQMDVVARCAHLRAREEKGKCPNCSSIVPMGVRKCPVCTAIFGEFWTPKPVGSVPSVEDSIQLLQRKGYAVEPMENAGWRVSKQPGGEVGAYAFSPMDLAGLARVAGAHRPLARWFADLLTAEEREQLLPRAGSTPAP